MSFEEIFENGPPLSPQKKRPRKSSEEQFEFPDPKIIFEFYNIPMNHSSNNEVKLKNWNFIDNLKGLDYWKDKQKAFQMYFDAQPPYLNDPAFQERISGDPVGLVNLGATCYINSFLQSWFYELHIRKAIYALPKEPQSSPIYQFQLLFAFLQYGNTKTFNPLPFIDSLELEIMEQQDVNEFYRLFLNLLEQHIQKKKNPLEYDFIKDLFRGIYRYGTECLTCGFESKTEQIFTQLEIPLDEDADDCSLMHMLEQYFQSESLSFPNQYNCPDCKEPRDAERKTKLVSVPNLMQFQLMRFVYDFDEGRKKVFSPVAIPLTLDLTPFLTQQDEESNKDDYLYELKAVLIHKGEDATSGHYLAHVYDSLNQKWWQINDEQVVDLNPESDLFFDIDDLNKKKKKKKKRYQPKEGEFISENAYMLLYSKKSLQPVEEEPQPPEFIMKSLKSLNSVHEGFVEKYQQKVSGLTDKWKQVWQQRSQFIQKCQKEPNPIDNAGEDPWDLYYRLEGQYVVPTIWLEHWLTQPFTKDGEKEFVKVDLTNLLCQHNGLDFEKLDYCKRIPNEAGEWLLKQGVLFYIDRSLQQDGQSQEQPENNDKENLIPLSKGLLLNEAFCWQCIYQQLKLHLFYEQHQKDLEAYQTLNKLFPLNSVEEEEETASLPRDWLREWQKKQPQVCWLDEEKQFKFKMPTLDLIYDSCKHGNYLLKTGAQRKQLSKVHFDFFCELFPELEQFRSIKDCKECQEHHLLSQQMDKQWHQTMEQWIWNRNSISILDHLEQQFKRHRLKEKVILLDRNQLLMAQSKHFMTSSFICQHGRLSMDLNECFGRSWYLESNQTFYWEQKQKTKSSGLLHAPQFYFYQNVNIDFILVTEEEWLQFQSLHPPELTAITLELNHIQFQLKDETVSGWFWLKDQQWSCPECFFKHKQKLYDSYFAFIKHREGQTSDSKLAPVFPVKIYEVLNDMPDFSKQPALVKEKKKINKRKKKRTSTDGGTSDSDSETEMEFKIENFLSSQSPSATFPIFFSKAIEFRSDQKQRSQRMISSLDREFYIYNFGQEEDMETVLDLKRAVAAYFQVSPLLLRLYHQGFELADNEKKFEELDLNPGFSVLEVHQDVQDLQQAKRNQSKTEKGFAGTLLQSSSK